MKSEANLGDQRVNLKNLPIENLFLENPGEYSEFPGILENSTKYAEIIFRLYSKDTAPSAELLRISTAHPGGWPTESRKFCETAPRLPRI